MTEVGDISKLADLLHQNGDKVLNSLSKLSLNAILLQRINKEFKVFLENGSDQESNKFQVLTSSHSRLQMIQDLIFLHDFIQKTISLKITNNANLSLLNNKVDISKFKSIKYLEIKKIPVKEIIGLKVIQSQLESIVCIKCMSKLEELLADCGRDNSSGFVWSELKEIVINYNNIKIIDTSIAFAPLLEVLDLSHNQIDDVKAIECLPNLKYVNLSFNCLNSLPVFNKCARKKIQVLILKNNYIEDLSGLLGLDHLVKLNVSYNWISSHESLCVLLRMSNLQNLSLKGNPISYHKDYKKNVISCLHINASFSDFFLDETKLSKYEKSIVAYKLVQTSSSCSESLTKSNLNNSFSMEVSSEKMRSVNGKKSGRVRLAVIPNLDDGTYEEIPAEINPINFSESVTTDHLLTKKRIEEARAAYGSDNWLRCEAGSIVQYILGLPPNDTATSTPVDIYSKFTLNSASNVVTTTAIIENHSDSSDEISDKGIFDSFSTCIEDHQSNYFSVENINNEQENSEKNCEVKNTESKDTSPDIEAIQDPIEEIEDENEKLYLVSKILNTKNNKCQEELFLSLTDSEIKEKDSIQGQIINKWSLSLLESCIKLQNNKLQINFNTIKKDKKERIYEMEPAEARSLCKILTQILETRTLHEMNQVLYKCIKCSSEFTRELNFERQDTNSQCPFCNAKLILEIEKPSISQVKYGEKELDQIKKSGSAASLDDLNCLPALQNTSVKRSDSDIEILSNPSQSSIEVIDGPTRMYGGNTPRRKRSSEERQIAQSVHGPENSSQLNSINALTESSSSGSVTDSICTAYESSVANPATSSSADNSELIEKIEEIKEKIKLKKKFETLLEVEEATESKDVEKGKKNGQASNGTMDEVQYSFVDFTKIDHRIKLLLYSEIFEHINEEFSFIVRCEVLPSNSAVSSQACFVCSNKKIYILKVIGPEMGDDASNFLQKTNFHRYNLKCIKSIQVLPWHQGLSVQLQDAHDKVTELLILLKDQRRTRNLVQFLTSPDSELSGNFKTTEECSQKSYLAMQHLLVSGASEDSNILYFCFLRSASVVDHPDVENVKAGAVLANNLDLLLFASEPTWFFEKATQVPQPAYHQKLNSLMNVESGSTRVKLHFLNEVEEKEEIWDLVFETPDSVEELIESVRAPWEEMFSVPLQITSL